MCMIQGVTLGIKDLNFTAHRGKMVARLTDGREVIIPVSSFPDIQQMPVKERNKWMVLDDQYFTFENMTLCAAKLAGVPRKQRQLRRLR